MSKKHRRCKTKNDKHFHKNVKDKGSNRNFYKSRGPRQHQYQHQNQLQETDVGITKFISNLPGYSAVIKARYSDFQVNEVNLDGEIAKLTDTSIPRDFAKRDECKETEDTDKSPTDKISQTTWDAIKAMVNEAEETTVELDATDLTKEDRATIHQCIKKAFGQKIYATTVNKDDKKTMIFKKHSGKVHNNRFKWPADKGEYVHFLVYKECVDTLEACLKIASSINISASNFTYAGVKDKRGKTTQWFSVRKVEPWKLIVKTRRISNIKIGNITFKDKPLKLGQLRGNKFRIALRNVMADDELIAKSLESLKANGFINYYGLQRFGNDKEVPTFSIGLQLLLGNWQEACKIILKPTQSDDPELDVTKAKKIYHETGDVSKALEQFEGNTSSCIEYLLLRGLNKEHANDFVNALANIPRNTRLLYIHSFQSLVWNLVASERIEKFGLKVVEGDLVLLEEGQDESINEDDGSDEILNKKSSQVKMLTADDCSNYSIYDVVLPLPGYDIEYPENMKEFYRETLEKYGLSLEMTKQKVQTYTLSGTYRKLMGKVVDLKWKIMRYSDPNHNLIRSDLEELRGHEEPVEDINGQYKALILDFFLNSSSYATMVLREILKTDTASSFHAKLNDYHITSQKEQKATEVYTSKNDVECNDITEQTGLLADAEKYELFKSVVFDTNEDSLKRKYTEDSDALEKNEKISKIDNVNENV